jgi:hypothetical protein
VRTIFVEVDRQIAERRRRRWFQRAPGRAVVVTIHATLGERLRRQRGERAVNVCAGKETLFDVAGTGDDDSVVLGQASVLASSLSSAAATGCVASSR